MRNWLASLLPSSNPAFARSALLRDTRFVVVDTELTSLERRTNHLLSIGAIVMSGTTIRMGEQFYRVINPGADIPAESILIHGLRPTDVANGDPPAEVVREFRTFCRDSVLVGHFVGIDVDALRKELRAAGESLLNPFLDTSRAYHWLRLHSERLRGLSDVQEHLNLAALAERYGLETGEAHHALCDAFVTAQLWQRLLMELEASGVLTLGRALRVARW
jgi:DNA polymerase-3 subunit epsilon